MFMCKGMRTDYSIRKIAMFPVIHFDIVEHEFRNEIEERKFVSLFVSKQD